MSIQYKRDANQIIIDNEELSVLVKQEKLLVNSISSLGYLPIVTKVDRTVSDEAQNEIVLKQALIDQANCQQLVYFRYGIADEEVSRHTYICPGRDGELTVLARGTKDSVITGNTKTEIKALLMQTLVAGGGLIRPEIDKRISTMAVLVFLAVVDAYRYVRYQSMLVHTRSPKSIMAQDVLDRLNDPADDFRWLLSFAESALPKRTGPTLTTEDVVIALAELRDAGLVSYMEADRLAEEPVVYSLTEAGTLICDGLLHDISKAAVRVSEINDDGTVGHAVHIFVRDSRFLWAFVMDGREGYICGIGGNGLSRVLDNALMMGLNVTEKISEPKPVVATVEKKCHKCNSEMGKNERFCRNCGTEVSGVVTPQQFCTGCGTGYIEGARFCNKCGKEKE